jgi:hypothetical protein
MRRRNILKTALGLPAAAAAMPAPAQAQTPSASAPANPTPKLEALSPDAAIDGAPSFFTPAQLQALRRLGDLLLPAFNAQPSASEAGVAEFLDFYVSQSDAATQNLWREGLDRLNAEARRRSGKVFRDLTGDEAGPVLAPLKQPWTYQGPADPFARFLNAARDLVLQTAFNSKEWAEAGGRRATGLNYLWRNLD